MEPNKKTSSKCGDVLQKGSSFLSFISLLLIVALFLRIESINRKTEMNDMRISIVERLIKIGSPRTIDHKNEMDTPENSEKSTNTKVRRSLISTSNISLSIEDVRSEITKQFNKLKPEALCQPLEKVCVPGPPGKKGNKGSRGRRGVQGAMGLPGRHGKQGIMGSQGMRGEKGEKGSAGPRGIEGLKGDPGESISTPDVTVSPATQTVSENQTATFYCSVAGNPRPTVTWSKVNDSFKAGSFVGDKDGGLKIIKTTFNDSGDYMCTAVSILGRDEKTAKLVVEVAPRMIKVPDRFLPIEAGSTAAVTCEVFSHPPSVITWIRAFGGLPKGRTSVKNGKLSIENFSKEDSGTYVCTARNKLGSVSAVTTLGFQRKPECPNYQTLSSWTRKNTYMSAFTLGRTVGCDNHLGPAWFRFEGAAGTKMATSCVQSSRCGTHSTGWLKDAHPTVNEGQVIRKVCFSWGGNCCTWSIDIKVRNCGDFYIYYINKTPPEHTCHLRYCGSD